MTTRERIIELLQADYDTVTACELADKLISETSASNRRVQWNTHSYVITLEPKAER